MSAKPVFHLLANAHLDPVWMWNWSEGFMEGVNTCKTMLDIMDEEPEFTFIRGEAAIYDFIERYDPDTFERIRRRVAEGRWDPVGGTWIQPDDNLPGSQCVLRQFELGQDYFRRAFGREATAAWYPDPFGHGVGTPELFAAAGMRYFAFCRPHRSVLPYDDIFFWRGLGGSRILCYRDPGGWYASERDGMHSVTDKLDGFLRQAGDFKVRNLGIFFGLGDHGGGAGRHHLEEIRRWRERHDEVEVRFSTLHGFFRALEEEIASDAVELPVFDGEMNFCLRGCYTSLAGLKKSYRRTENDLARADRISGLHAGILPMVDYLDSWKALCFNAFHDILPGSCVESAMEEELDWLGYARHRVRLGLFDTMTALGRAIDTARPFHPTDRPEPSSWLWVNPWPRPFKGFVELETSLDYRPIREYHEPDGLPSYELLDADGEPLRYQVIETEHHTSLDAPPWQRRFLFELELPPGGWQLVTAGYNPHPRRAAVPDGGAGSPAPGVIANEFYRVTAAVGAETLQIRREGASFLGREGISFATYDDFYGSWGEMKDIDKSAASCLALRSRWRISRCRVTESGPERAVLWVEFTGDASRLTLLVRLCRRTDFVELRYRLDWMERGCRLKMQAGQGESVRYEVPGGVAGRGVGPVVPGGRWAEVRLPSGEGYGVVNDSWYGWDNEGGYFSGILVRGARFCTDVTSTPEQYPERPTADQGEHQGVFLLTGAGADLNLLAENLEQPPERLLGSIHPGALPRRGHGWSVSGAGVKVIDFRADGVAGAVITCQNQSDVPVTAVVTKDGRSWRHTLPPWKIERLSCRD